MDRQHLLALLEQDELDQVVEIFRKISPSLHKSLQGQITLTVSQYNGYLKDKHGGGVSQGHLGIALNKLRASMNYLIGQLPESVFPAAGFARSPDRASPAGNTSTIGDHNTKTVVLQDAKSGGDINIIQS